MKKIERNIKALRNILKIIEQLENEIAALNYYTTNKYFDSYLQKHQEDLLLQLLYIQVNLLLMHMTGD